MAALQAAAGDVEELHGVRVELASAVKRAKYFASLFDRSVQFEAS